MKVSWDDGGMIDDDDYDVSNGVVFWIGRR